ncbi:hypothetical protein E2542_SST17165 [Spatholobus suberectus]|nr:hypothetical protein E2542_SST17165 [Spatholobus suberectus]
MTTPKRKTNVYFKQAPEKCRVEELDVSSFSGKCITVECNKREMQYWKKEMANEEDSVIVGATGPNWVDVTPRDIMVECKEREMPYQKNEVSNEAYYPPDELAGPRNWFLWTTREGQPNLVVTGGGVSVAV